jgi:hypothetical protein
MKHSLPVRRLEYRIPEMAAANSYMTNVHIDFEKGNLSLEGDSQLMVTETRRSWFARSAFRKGRIKVNATILPGFNAHLSDKTSDEFVFSLEGILEDGKSINSCSGLLVLVNMAGSKGHATEKWQLAVYLYDEFNGKREIKLMLTMHYVAKNAELN